jgi:hypothetical protein
MSTSLTSRIRVQASATLTSVLDLVTSSSPLTKTVTVDLANGVAADQGDVIWSDQRTLATATTEDLDLAGGGLTDVYGTAFAPAKVKVLVISSASANTTNLTLFGDANGVPILDDPSDTITLKPGGVFCIVDPTLAGYAVTAGTGDIIQVANAAGASATYDIIIIGTSS